MLQFFIFSLLLITNVKCQTNCDNPKGCPEEEVTFKEPLRWCTVNNDENKECELMIKAASKLGYHNIACTQEISKASCLRAISKRKADVVAVVNVLLGNDLDCIVSTTSDKNLVDLSKIEDSTCVFKLYSEEDGGFKGYYRRHRWTCPSANFVKVLCKDHNATVCGYFNEIVMRYNDPNVENVTKLLTNLWSISQAGDSTFSYLLFQGYTQQFYTEMEGSDPPSIAGTVVMVLVFVGLVVGLVAFTVKKKFFKKASNANAWKL